MPWPRVSIDSFVEISQLRKLELVDLSGLVRVTVGRAKALECAIRAQQELGLLQPGIRLYLPNRKKRDIDPEITMSTHDDSCIHLCIDSSHQHVFSRTQSGDGLDAYHAVQWYQDQRRANAGTNLILSCFITATVVKAAFKFVAMVSRHRRQH